jgi:two-component system, chemotaxis family, chemotaxis protein CheY
VRILVVDNMGYMRHWLRQVLSAAGHAVTTAATGEEALAILKSENVVELVVTDYRMPGMNGFELFRQAQQINYAHNHGGAAIPDFILMTGIRPPASGPTREMELIDSAKEFGFAEIFHKPIDRNLLLEQVASLERRKRQAAGVDPQTPARSFQDLLADIGRIIDELVQCTDSNVVEELAKQLRDGLTRSDERLTVLAAPPLADQAHDHQPVAADPPTEPGPVATGEPVGAAVSSETPAPIDVSAQSM